MKKIGVIILSIVLVLTIFFVLNKNEEVILDNVKIKEEVNRKITFAMYKETSNNTYEEVEGNTFPTEGYILNLAKSKCIDESGNEINDILSYDISNKKVIVDTNKTSYCYLYFAKEVVEFDYTGSEQEFTIPYSGTYKLEIWGAQGDNYSSSIVGGKGGYSVGNIYLIKENNIHIVIGGSDGYNGGESGRNDPYIQIKSGGGATHIATEGGLLTSLEPKKDKILLVSGGGGGSFYRRDTNGNYISYGSGGNAGGYYGGTSIGTSTSSAFTITLNNTGGSQIIGGSGSCFRNNVTSGTACASDGAFGKGGYGNSGGGGGGGYWGGGGGSITGGGGGSGYIGNPNLTNKHMTCYNCTTSNDVDTKTISNTCVNANPVSDCSKQGHGYAKITFIG